MDGNKSEAKPWSRWWRMGIAVDEQDLTRFMANRNRQMDREKNSVAELT